MTSAAAMISGSGGVEGGTTIRPGPKDSRTSLVPTPEHTGSTRRSSTRSPSSSYASTSPALPMAGMMMHEPEHIRMRGSAAGNNRRRVKDFNDSITCTLCNGYLVEATSVNDCLHSFCRSCIVKYLECNKYCPRCKSYNSKPITVANLRPDRTLGAIVYKLVPALHKSENQRIIQFYASISSNIVPSEEDDPTGQGTFQLLDDQNFFSPDEPISLSLEYHYDTVAEHGGASGGQLPITYLQCPAAVTVHHLYKFILTKNGLQVGSGNIRVEIIYEEEILPHDFTLMDVAYCFDYKRIAPMRFFYRILIHSTAKLAPTASAYHRVEGQDKNSTNGSNSGSPDTTSTANPGKSSADSTPTVKTTPTTAGVSDGQRPGSTKTKAAQETGGSKNQPTGRTPREETANNSVPMAAVNGHHRTKSSTTMTKPTSSEVVRSMPQPSSPVVTSSSSTGLKMVLVPKGKHEPNAGTADAKRSPPPLKAIQAASAVNGGATQKQSSKEPTAGGKEGITPPVEKEKSTSNSTLKCYVNLKTQTIVGAPSSSETVTPKATESELPKQPPAEIPRLKIDLKAKLSIPREKNAGLSPPSSSSSSAATSPSSATSATSSAGKSPVWPMGKEEYAKTIGLKPVYATTVVPEASLNESDTHSSSHRKRKKGKHSKEAGSSGKRRKLHAEISSQQDASLKMKVKLTEKPPKHERLKSSGNEEEPAQPKSPRAVVLEPVPIPPKPTKVIDITKDDDEVKFVAEQKLTNAKIAPAPAAVLPKDIPVSAPVPVSSITSKEKLNEMRSVRHKPMVYIPNLDRSLSADMAGVGSSINSLLESVGAKTPLLKPTPALIPTSTASSGLAGKSQPRTPILSRPMPSCPPLAYPIASSPVTSSTTGSIRTMAAPPAIKRSISTDSGNGGAAKVPRLEPSALMPPVSLMPAKQPAPIQAPMFNFAKGANRAKAAQQAAGMVSPTQPEHIPYRSPISASYTKEIPSTKKPIPNLLLPPATVSVTKMSDIVSSTLSPDNGRPAVEFLRIPSNAPVADKPTLAPFTTPKMSTKTTRPPPATIPLIKIKKPTVPGSNGNESVQGGVTPPNMTPLTPPMRPKVPVRSSSDPMASSNTNILDLSGGGGASSRRLSDDVIILDHSPAKSISDTTNRSRVVDSNRGKPSTGLHYSPMKRSPEMINFSAPTSTSALLSHTPLPPVQKTLAPLPKLTEINRHRSLTVRQPNASIRSIPNPSALAFRGTQSGVATTVSNTSSSTAVGMLMAGFSSSSAQQSNGSLTGSNRSNGNAITTSMTSSSTTIKTNTPSLSNGAARQQQLTPMMGITSGNATAKSTSTNGSTDPKPPHNGANTAHNNNNNNNSSKVANANTGLLAAKKKIETVAAVLKAAAATADTTSQRSTSSTSATSTSPNASHSVPPLGARDEPKGKPQKEDNTTHATGAVTTAPSTATVSSSDSLSMVAMSGVNRGVNKTHADSIVTSVTTASIASVTGTSSRNSPAGIVNVG